MCGAVLIGESVFDPEFFGKFVSFAGALIPQEYRKAARCRAEPQTSPHDPMPHFLHRILPALAVLAEYQRFSPEIRHIAHACGRHAREPSQAMLVRLYVQGCGGRVSALDVS